MNNNQKLTSLANEFKATMNHAEEIFNMYMDAAIEQAVMEAFNELSDVDKMILLLGLLTGAVEDKIVFDLEELLAGEDAAEEESQDDAYWESDDFVKELIRLYDRDKQKFIQNPGRMSKSDLATLQGDNFVIHIIG
jgi:F0F1-type ATP synthase gamma subunit